MAYKTAVIVCGSNHTGTSAMTKLLLDNGYKTGQYTKSENIGYKTYEDDYFKNCVQKAVGLIPGGYRNRMLSMYVASTKLNTSKNIVFKYPKAVFALQPIVEDLMQNTKRDVKVIYMLRDYNGYMRSTVHKSQGNMDYFGGLHEYVLALAIAASFDLCPIRIQPFSRLLSLSDIPHIESFLGMELKKTSGITNNK